MLIPPVRVLFDDGTTVELQPKPRDMALAERDFHHNYSEAGAFRSAYATALAALGRAQRAGTYDGPVPGTIDELMDIADVEVVSDDEDPEGKGSDPVPPIG